jgi:hypothetical protein
LYHSGSVPGAGSVERESEESGTGTVIGRDRPRSR